MKRKVLLLLASVTIVASATAGHSGGDYELSKSTVDGGGGRFMG